MINPFKVQQAFKPVIDAPAPIDFDTEALVQSSFNHNFFSAPSPIRIDGVQDQKGGIQRWVEQEQLEFQAGDRSAMNFLASMVEANPVYQVLIADGYYTQGAFSGESPDIGKKISAELANQLYPMPKPWNEEVHENVAKNKYNNYLQKLLLEQAVAKTRQGRGELSNFAVEFAVGLGAGFADYATLMTSMVPVTRMAQGAGYLKKIDQTQVRGQVAEGIIDAAVTGTAIEGLNFYTQNASGSVYTPTEAAMNVFFGTVLGGAFSGVSGGYKSMIKPNDPAFKETLNNMLFKMEEAETYLNLTEKQKEFNSANIRQSSQETRSSKTYFTPEQSEKMTTEYKTDVDGLKKDQGIEDEPSPEAPQREEPKAEDVEAQARADEAARVEVETKQEELKQATFDAVAESKAVFRDVFKGVGELDDAGNFNIVRNASEIQNSKHRAALEKGEATAKRDGFFVIDDNTVYVVTDNIQGNTPRQLLKKGFEVMFEESVGHYGLRRVLGEDEFKGLIDRVKLFHKDEFDSLKKSFPDATDDAISEEVLVDTMRKELTKDSIPYGIARDIVGRFRGKFGKTKYESIMDDYTIARSLNKTFEQMQIEGKIGITARLDEEAKDLQDQETVAKFDEEKIKLENLQKIIDANRKFEEQVRLERGLTDAKIRGIKSRKASLEKVNKALEAQRVEQLRVQRELVDAKVRGIKSRKELIPKIQKASKEFFSKDYEYKGLSDLEKLNKQLKEEERVSKFIDEKVKEQKKAAKEIEDSKKELEKINTEAKSVSQYQKLVEDLRKQEKESLEIQKSLNESRKDQRKAALRERKKAAKVSRARRESVRSMEEAREDLEDLGIDVRFSTVNLEGDPVARDIKADKKIKQQQREILREMMMNEDAANTLGEGGIYNNDEIRQLVAHERAVLLSTQKLDDITSKIQENGWDFYDFKDYVDWLINDGADQVSNEFSRRYINRLYQELKPLGLWGRFQKGDLDQEIDRAYLGQDASQDAQVIADAIREVNMAMIAETNNAGGATLFSETRITRRNHSVESIFKWAGEKYKTGRKKGGAAKQFAEAKQRVYEKWKREFMNPDKLDMNKSFFERGITNEKDIEQSLQSAFDGIVSGIHGDTYSGEVGSRIQKNPEIVAAHRLYHFKDPSTESLYRKLFGNGTIFDGVMGDIHINANKAGLYNSMGPYYREVFDKGIVPTLNEMAQGLTKGEKTQVNKLKKSAETSFLMMEGALSSPANLTLDFATKLTKSIVTMNSLGQVLFASFSDPVYASRALGRMEGGDAKAMTGAMLETAGILKPKNEVDKFALRGTAGDIESLVGSFTRFDAEGSFAQKGNRYLESLNDLFYKTTAMTYWNRKWRDGVSVAVSRRMALYGEKSLSELDTFAKGFADDIRKFGVSDNDWEVLKGAIEETEGTRFMLVEGIENITNDALADNLRSRGTSVTPQSIARERNRLRSLLGGYVSGVMDEAILTPGLRERKMLLGQNQAGTPWHTFRTLAFMFKSFPLTAFNKVFMKDGKTFLAGGAAQIAFVVAFTAILQYFSRNAQNFLNGKSAIPINSLDTLFDMVVKGGGLPLLGDVMFNDYKGYGASLGDIALGPIGGRATELLKMAQTISSSAIQTGDMTEEDSKRINKQLVRQLEGIIPFKNHLAVKPIYDMTISAWLKTWADPDYNKLYERSLNKRGLTLNEERSMDIFLSTILKDAEQ